MKADDPRNGKLCKANDFVEDVLEEFEDLEKWSDLIECLECVKEKILVLPFSDSRSKQVDRIDLVIDWLRGQRDDNS